jgi:hypothetical protein
MNLFIERSATTKDVVATLSVDNPAIKSNVILNAIEASIGEHDLWIEATSGTPLFQVSKSFGSEKIIIAQGTCLLLKRDDSESTLQLFDDNPFSETPIFESKLSAQLRSNVDDMLLYWFKSMLQ